MGAPPRKRSRGADLARALAVQLSSLVCQWRGCAYGCQKARTKVRTETVHPIPNGSATGLGLTVDEIEFQLKLEEGSFYNRRSQLRKKFGLKEGEKLALFLMAL